MSLDRLGERSQDGHEAVQCLRGIEWLELLKRFIRGRPRSRHLRREVSFLLKSTRKPGIRSE